MLEVQVGTDLAGVGVVVVQQKRTHRAKVMRHSKGKGRGIRVKSRWSYNGDRLMMLNMSGMMIRAFSITA